MKSLLPDPRNEYETLADALRIFQESHEHRTPDAIAELQDVVARVTEAWQQCEAQRTSREKEFRYHVVRLKILLAGAHQTLETLYETHLLKAA
jgi:hypothetical protein